jgi:hypothetical protein
VSGRVVRYHPMWIIRFADGRNRHIWPMNRENAVLILPSLVHQGQTHDLSCGVFSLAPDHSTFLNLGTGVPAHPQ